MSERRVRITLVRHGESLANRTQRWQGQGDSPLSELGREQAIALASRLQGRHYDRIVASDLERASATASALGRSFERDCSFREFDIGQWEGLTREEVIARFPAEMAQLEAGEDVAIGGAESYASFCARIDAAVARVRDSLSVGQHALVVCHGGVIGALVSGVLGLRGVRELPFARVFNTSITELAYDEAGRSTLSVFNDSLHLSALALFPHPAEMTDAVGLLCAETPSPSFGVFGAHYDCEQAGSVLAQIAAGVPSFPALLEEVRTRHPGQRVALSAAAARICRWVHETVQGPGTVSGALVEPSPGSLCHIGTRDGRVALLDYGVS